MTRTVLKEYPCNCVIVAQSKEGIGGHSIEYCPLHKSAPGLYEACKEMMERFNRGTRFPLQSTNDKMNKALAEAESKDERQIKNPR